MPSRPTYLLALTTLITFSLACLAPMPAMADGPAPPAALDFGNKETPADSDAEVEPNPHAEDDRIADEVGKTVTRWNLVSGTPIVLVGLGAKLWDWGSTHSFRYGQDGWFEALNPSGGTDKAAHIYACYASTRLFTSVFDWTEGDRDTAIGYGALMGLFIGVGIEIGDGFSQSYGFSITDIIADFIGIGVGALLDKYPTLDDAFAITVWWWPSNGYIKGLFKKDSTYGSTFTDYSGQNYFVSLKFGGIPWVKDTPLRYFKFDLAFTTDGYKTYEQKDRRQTLYMGFAVDLGELISSMLSKDPWHARLVEDIFKYVHPPIGWYPQELRSSRHGKPFAPELP